MGTPKTTLYEYCTQNPEYKHLLDEYDASKNKLSVHQIGAHSGTTKAWWYCSKHNHSWQEYPANRIKYPSTPCCDNTGKKATPNYNFAVICPELLKDWDYEKNTVKPEDLRPLSHERVYWKCHRCKNEWDTKLGDRVGRRNEHTECPHCGDRHTTKPERLLTEYFSLYFKDVRKVKIDGVEFDISIPQLGVVIEYDGYPWHLEKIDIHTKKLEIANRNNLILINIAEYKDTNAIIQAVKEQYTDKHNVIYYKVNNTYNLDGLLSLVIKYFNTNANLNLQIPTTDFISKAITSSRMMPIEDSLWNSINVPWIRHWIAPQDIDKAKVFKDTSSEKITIKCPNCNREWETVIRYIKKQFRGCTKRAGGCGYQHCIGDMLEKTRAKDMENYYNNLAIRREQARISQEKIRARNR